MTTIELIKRETVTRNKVKLHIYTIQNGQDVVTATHVPKENFHGAVVKKANGGYVDGGEKLARDLIAKVQ